MQHSSNDNIPGWRQRLHQFEEEDLPADQEMRWERFQQKQLLAPAPTKKRTVYWMAAAALMGILFYSIYFLNNASVIEIESPASVKTTTIPATTSDAVVEIITEPIDTNHEKSVVTTKPINFKNDFLIKQDTANVVPIEAPVMLVNIPPAIIDSHPVTTAQVQLPIKPKKLKLVHLNELNYPGNSTDLAAQEGKPYFPVNTPTRKVYGKSDADPTSKDKDNLIRIKLFP